MSSVAIEARARTAMQRLASWMEHEALPRWAVHPPRGRLAFVESFEADGESAREDSLRLRVAARQTAVYALASLHGVSGSRAVAGRGWHGLVQHYWSTVSGWSPRVATGGEVLDYSFGLYDQAFGVYACACWTLASGDREAVHLAHRTLDLIDRRLRSPGVAGWRSISGRPGRDQNSHMHFLEALLQLHQVAPGWRTRVRICEILELLAAHLFDPTCGAVSEQFGDRWQRPESPCFEPGHQHEWLWLLDRARRAGFSPPIASGSLQAFAQAYGWDPVSGMIYNSCDSSGTPLDCNHRLWPHCEALRAATLAGPQGQEEAERIAGLLLETFLAGPFAGGWIDRFNHGGLPAAGPVPASTLYHLWGAVEALVESGWARFGEGAPC